MFNCLYMVHCKKKPEACQTYRFSSGSKWSCRTFRSWVSWFTLQTNEREQINEQVCSECFGMMSFRQLSVPLHIHRMRALGNLLDQIQSYMKHQKSNDLHYISHFQLCDIPSDQQHLVGPFPQVVLGLHQGPKDI